MTGEPKDVAPESGETLLARIRGRDRRAVAEAMSIAESTPGKRAGLLAALYQHTGHAHVIGLTGVPGSGKSTMVRALAKRFREVGKTVGIVAIDPSSPFSGGAILGDRLRMTGLSGDPGVFIRSMATRGTLGGLASATLDVVDVLDVAGFDVVIVETVGVGQDEVDIVQAAHTVIVVSAPGLGDDVQAIKAGVLEIADVHVVSKCDRPDAEKTLAELKAMQSLGGGARGRGSWKVPVLGTSAQAGTGIEPLVDAVLSHGRHLQTSGEIEERRERILEMRVLKSAEGIVRAKLLEEREGRLKPLIDQMMTRDLDPEAAAHQLLRLIQPSQ